jgi:hypothetical protein
MRTYLQSAASCTYLLGQFAWNLLVEARGWESGIRCGFRPWPFIGSWGRGWGDGKREVIFSFRLFTVCFVGT